MKQLKKRLALLLLGLGLVLVNSSTYGFTLLSSYWFEGKTTFRVNFPAGTTDQALFSGAFQDAISAWNTSSSFIYDSDASAAPADPCVDDGFNNVAFASDVCGEDFDSGTLAIALTTSINGGAIRSIILFNDNELWDVYNGSQGFRAEFDLRRVAVHELGHSLGLDHSTSTQAIMFPLVGNVELPSADDLAGVDARYDIDGDGIVLAFDNCSDKANVLQTDSDLDGDGDACDSDVDGDGVLNNTGVDQSYEADSTRSTGFIFGANAAQIFSLAQTFEVASASVLNAVALPLADFVCDDGILTIQIRRLDGENPSELSEDILQMTEIVLNEEQDDLEGEDTINADTRGLFTVDLPEEEYEAGQRLAIVLQHTDTCRWLLSDTVPLPDYPLGSGRFVQVSDPSNTWFSLAANVSDLPFETVVTLTNPDNCPANSNLDQMDSDSNGVGDVCEGIFGDQDGDSVADANDNCPTVPNIQQLDSDENGIGDFCEGLATGVTDEVCAPIVTQNGAVTLICF